MYAAQMKHPDTENLKQIADRIVEYVSEHQAERVTAKSVIDSITNGTEKDDVSKALRTAIQSGVLELTEDMSLRTTGQ